MITKEQVESVVKWGIGLGAIAVAGIVAAFVIQSLVLVGVCVMVALGTINLAPVIATKFSSWKILALEQDARANPVPTLIKQYEAQQKRFQTSKKAIESFSTTTKNFKSKLDDFRSRNTPGVDEMQLTYDNMKRVLADRLGKLINARDGLVAFSNQISVEQDRWTMSQEIRAANATMAENEDEDPVETMKRRVALNSITSNLNLAMSELDVSMALSYKQLPEKVANLEVLSSGAIDAQIKQLEMP